MALLLKGHRMWYAKLIEAKGICDWEVIVKLFIERLSVKDRKTKCVKLVNTVRPKRRRLH